MIRRRSPVQWLLAAVVLLLQGALISRVSADEPAPARPFRQTSADGRFVFVMLAPTDGYTSCGADEQANADCAQLRAAFPSSGLYRNDGSSEPLWTVDWYAHQVDIASDGVHLVRHGPWASALNDEAVSFFANGKLLQKWLITELVHDPERLEHSVSHFFWCADERYDDSRQRFGLRTVDGMDFVFDVRDGAIVASAATVDAYWPQIRRYWRIATFVLLVLLSWRVAVSCSRARLGTHGVSAPLAVSPWRRGASIGLRLLLSAPATLLAVEALFPWTPSGRHWSVQQGIDYLVVAIGSLAALIGVLRTWVQPSRRAALLVAIGLIVADLPRLRFAVRFGSEVDGLLPEATLQVVAVAVIALCTYVVARLSQRAKPHASADPSSSSPPALQQWLTLLFLCAGVHYLVAGYLLWHNALPAFAVVLPDSFDGRNSVTLGAIAALASALGLGWGRRMWLTRLSAYVGIFATIAVVHIGPIAVAEPLAWASFALVVALVVWPETLTVGAGAAVETDGHRG